MNTPVIKETTVNAPIEKVWAAITDSNTMKQWYFDIPGFKAEPGFEFEFEGGEPGGTVYVHLCKVVEAIPNKKLSHTWRYEGYPGDTLVTWELFDEGGKTRVKLTHTGLETFPADVRAFRKENFIAGWNDIVGQMLPEFVEKG